MEVKVADCVWSVLPAVCLLLYRWVSALLLHTATAFLTQSDPYEPPAINLTLELLPPGLQLLCLKNSKQYI